MRLTLIISLCVLSFGVTGFAAYSQPFRLDYLIGFTLCGVLLAMLDIQRVRVKEERIGNESVPKL